jgi:hypothetical protein
MTRQRSWAAGGQSTKLQIGEALSLILYAFAETDDKAKIFMAKWDIKDSFWRMDSEEGQEYNFAYVLQQQPPEEPIILVVPMSLQMGSRDKIQQYIETPVASLPEHKFIKHIMTSDRVHELEVAGEKKSSFSYMVEVYIVYHR